MTAKPIVAATDGSEESLLAVEWAAREATLRGAPLRIVSAADLLPRMVEGHGGSGIDTVSDVIRKNRPGRRARLALPAVRHVARRGGARGAWSA